MLDGSHHGEGERDVAVPAIPGSGLVMLETELVLGGLEAVFDCPSMPLDADQRLDRGFRRAPCDEVGEIAVGDVTPDQHAARPQAMVFFVEFFRLQIGQLEVAPVIQDYIWTDDAQPAPGLLRPLREKPSMLAA